MTENRITAVRGAAATTTVLVKTMTEGKKKVFLGFKGRCLRVRRAFVTQTNIGDVGSQTKPAELGHDDCTLLTASLKHA